MQAVSAGMLTTGAQPQIEGSDSGIAADSRHRRHVQHSPDLGTPAPDATAAAQAATITVEGRQANQGGDLLAIESSQLGQRCEQRARQHLPTQGTERSSSSRSRQSGVLRITVLSSSSKPDSRFSNQRMCSSMLRCKTLGAIERRFFSAVNDHSAPVGKPRSI